MIGRREQSPRPTKAFANKGDFRIQLKRAGSPNLKKIERRKEIRIKIMKATGIVRRIDDLGRVVIPKEIRRTMRIREGDTLPMTLTHFDRYCFAINGLSKRLGTK